MKAKHLIFLALAMCWLALSPAQAAEESAVPQSAEQIKLSFAPLVKKVAPAVVNIYTKRVVERQMVNPLFNDPLFRQFFGGQDLGGPTQKREERSLGSGVIVQSDGLIVSNAHVISGADEIRVVLSDGHEFDAKVILIDEKTDLAVIRIPAEGMNLPHLSPGDSDVLEVGDLVLAIGNPFGVGQTVTSGIVSAVARTAMSVSDFNFFIQTDAAINPGNSGGALVAMDGTLMGVNTAIYSRDGGSLGIGFAIPANMVKTVVMSALSGGKIQRPWIGVSMQNVTADVAESLGLPGPHGAMITAVYPKGPAKRAGLAVGDVVLSVEGKQVQDPVALRFRVATVSAQDKVELEVFRKGKTFKTALALEPPPEDPPRQKTKLEGQNVLSGATIMNISPAVADEMGLDFESSGVVVSDIDPGAIALRLGIRVKDRIAEINDKKISSVADIKAAMAEKSPSWKITLQRGGKMFSIMVN